jgi:hypothetical protein
MRRVLVLSLGAGAVLALVGMVWNSRASQVAEPVAGKAAAPEHPLPIRQVILFNSGVGYMQREGDVSGDAKVDLSFPTTDINDLLKSLVLQDLGGGRVSTVSYDSHDPLDKILRSFAIDLNNNPTFGQILNQARGEKIEVQLMGKDKAIPQKITGQIVGMEVKQTHEKDRLVSHDYLNLSGAEGLQSIPLEQILGVRFLNPTLENEFQRALRVLAASHDTQKKTVSLGFTGQGKRAVRVGYVVERPIWKTSYRLRMEANGKVFLQGWAMVENTSDDDWNDVRMVLVSGRPISFRMNLYEPLYIPRPTVEPDQFASLRPPVYSGAMNPGDFQAGINPAFQAPNPGGGLAGALGGAAGAAATEGAPARGLGQGGMLGGFNGMPMNPQQLNWMLNNGAFGNPMAGFGQFGQMGQLGQLGGQGNTANPYQNLNGRQQNFDVNNRLTFEELQQRRQQQEDAKKSAKEKGAVIAMNFKEGIQSVASAEEVGDYFQYIVDQRISLSRQKSAMLPIVDQNIEGSKVSIFNEGVHAKFPLLGLRLKNTSGLPLTQGPITVYDNSTYAGDTRILDVQPNEERLLSYALDQGTEVKTEVKSSPSPEMTFRIGQAAMSALYKEREIKTYTIKNRSVHDRTLIIEHPIRSGWKLVDPAKPAEQTRNLYRFEVKVLAGGSASFSVAEDQPRVDQVALQGGQAQYVASTGITVKEVVTQHEEKLQSVQVVKGVLTPTLKARETRSRYVQNLSDINRVFNVDHIVRAEWVLLPAQGTPVVGPSVHRSTLKIEKGKAAHQDVTEERVYQEKGKIVKDLPEAKVREYLNSPAVSVKVKDGLTRSLDLAKKLAEETKSAADLDRQLKALSEDQARLRENLRIIPQTSDPYKKFLDKFVSQETEIEGLQRTIRVTQASLATAQRDYDTFAATWTAE